MKQQLKLGQKWRNRNGDEVIVISRLVSNDGLQLDRPWQIGPFGYFVDNQGRENFRLPTQAQKDADGDLVELLADAPAGLRTETKPYPDTDQLSIERIAG